LGSENDPNAPLTYSDLMTGQQLAKEYGEIIKSRSIAKEVADSLKLPDVNASLVQTNIHVTVREETRLLIVSCNNKVPKRTKQIIDKVNEVFIKRVKMLSTFSDVAVIDEANIPTLPIPPKHKIKILLGLVAGLMFSFTLIFFIEELDDTVKTAEDVEKGIDLKVLGTIPILKLK
jgi:capsular polysaccharide biosynthesis protein